MSILSKRVSALAICAVVVGLAACGDGESDGDPRPSEKEQVTQVAQDYADALNAGDAEAVCALESNASDSCVKATEEEISDGSVLTEGFGRVTAVRLEGDVARANFASGGFLVLSEQGGEWKVGAPDGAATSLGAPEAPETERCSPAEEKKIRQRAERTGQQVPSGPLYCETK